jgi:transketolase N-terminal domain/subunit
MLIENVQRCADVACSLDAPRWRAKSWDIADVKGGNISNLFSGYTETNNIHNRTTVIFVLENVNKKLSVKILLTVTKY